MAHVSSWLLTGVACLMLAASSAEASDKSSARPNVISVPKGPGSISGLGESFEADLYSGSARESIPIALPPGTGGLTPSLSLSYDSGFGNGPLGIGWSLGLSSIQVQTEKGLPRYEGNDRFLLDGAEIVQVGNGVYRLKNEGRYLRARRVEEHWEVDAPDGRKLIYGRSASARVESGSQVFRWALEEVADVFGSRIAYTYRKDLAELYLAEIAYNKRTGTAKNRVALEYEARPDVVADYRARFRVATALRLKSIGVFAQEKLVRRYRLSYDESNGFSRLARVTQVGNDDRTALPDVTFRYTSLAAESPAPVSMRVDEVQG